MEFANNTRQLINTSQSIYDAFNTFIFSNDTKVLGKLLAKMKLLQMVEDVPGDIVECGVFKGSGLAAWLKIREIFWPRSFRKVIGFDFFDSEAMIAKLRDGDQDRMREMFEERGFPVTEDYVTVLTGILQEAGFDQSNFELIKGDINFTAREYVESRPGARISILYMDLDVEEATYNTLSWLWDRVVVGGLVVFDEYGYHQWSESAGADRFFTPRGIKIRALDFCGPTAYVIKEG